jgi:hypothetical protein
MAVKKSVKITLCCFDMTSADLNLFDNESVCCCFIDPSE